MPTFGSIVNKEQADVQTTDTPRPVYSEPINKSEYQPTAADLKVSAAVDKLDNVYLAWIDAWNGQAPEHVTDKLWHEYQRQWQLTQETIIRCWYIHRTV